MGRSFCIPGILILFCAFVLSFLVSISLPYLTALDITRVHINAAASSSSANAISQLRFGIWSYCFDAAKGGDRTCSPKGHGYSVQVQSPNGGTETIGSSWTRGLAVHPVATAVTFVALLLSFSTHVTVTLVASLMSFLAALLTLIAFAIDIALYVYVKHQMNKLNDHISTITGPGFWLTFVSFILLLLAGCTVCFGRRRDRMSNADTYPMASTKPWYRRFRR
ncbi:pali-domain-containing protein [Rickenella mellea]|uniref:Pali-domain-containing protein n=1 Tax=Rickenella mellea TaxID=50990 RepID=A0A4Y7QHW2_9AGAM|nr:pali-domain-containing protein [Rickenella mellea]